MQHVGWRGELQKLIDRHAGVRMNGNVASFRTRELTAKTLFAVFNTLHLLGYRLQNPANLGARHVDALVKHWYAEGRAVSTMQNELSMLRKFGTWIGKKGFVGRLADYLPDVPAMQLRRTAVASISKSWTENGVNVDAKLAQADALDERFGMMLRIELAFGLRRREILLLKPWKSDHGDTLTIYPNTGSKTGRPRIIALKNDYQRTMLDYVKARMPKGQAMAWRTTRRGMPAGLKYCQKEYSRRMKEIGITAAQSNVTGHGLRAEFAENAAMTDPVRPFIPATLGGTADQLSLEDLHLVRSQVSEMLGHSRTAITNSYYGSFARWRSAPGSQTSEARA
uniref:phage integrase N-terminal domain-containing protein n=1 Tax=Paraburkholderia sp. J69-2 TaxID=2805437 RepID=UPI002AB31D42